MNFGVGALEQKRRKEPPPYRASNNYIREGAALTTTSTKMATVASKVKRGALIIFEGVDRCGKTTQCKRLVESLSKSGVASKFMRFPDRETTIGKMINAYLQSKADLDDRAIHLLFSANRWEKKEELLSLLDKGTTVIVDRYAYSGVAFSGSKDGLSLEWCRNSDRGLPKPDLVIFLDISVEDASKRGEFGAERYEKAEFQKKVRANFLKMKDETWKVMDATNSIEELGEQVAGAVAATIARVKRGAEPVAELWPLQGGGAGTGVASGAATT